MNATTAASETNHPSGGSSHERRGRLHLDLADFTGFSEATSARHLATLIDFGLIHVNAFGDFKLAVPDVFAALDELEATCIVPDRRAKQAAAFEAARAAIDARQVDRQP